MMKGEKRIVFLYTELAPYIRVCLERLAEKEVDVHVFAYPVNSEAPFEFDLEHTLVHYYRRHDFITKTLLAKVAEINPQAIVCSGWIDKGYVEICQKFKNKAHTIVAFDNKYNTGIRATLAIARARQLYRSAFTHAWVPGAPQVAYAKKLGFEEDRIEDGFYTADYAKLSTLEWSLAGHRFPKRFVFMGRYIDSKGVFDLWKAFALLNKNGWELHCAGQGPLYDARVQAAGVVHHGFVQQQDFGKFAAQGGVFVLPSHFEPWGVVVHEFASTGYPLLCSTEVGSVSAFLENGHNGFVFEARDAVALAKAMQKVIDLSDMELFEMGIKSRELAMDVNVETWVDKTIKFLF